MSRSEADLCTDVQRLSQVTLLSRYTSERYSRIAGDNHGFNKTFRDDFETIAGP
jgi:hypothetical protein